MHFTKKKKKKNLQRVNFIFIKLKSLKLLINC